jgi:hypothetical protein
MYQELLNSIVTSAPTFSLFDVIANVIIAALLGLLVAFIYRATFQGQAYSESFVTTLVIITMVTSIVIMVIGNNLARAFGLVGAMSIIRFRTAVKDAKDIAFVFFALAAGLAAGASNHIVGVVGCLLVSFIILLLYIFKLGAGHKEELYLRFWMLPEEGNGPLYKDVFDKYLAHHKLINIRSARLGEFLELSFIVQFKNRADHQNFVREMSALEGTEGVALTIGESTSD